MITIDFCIEEDGYVFLDQPDGLPIPSIRCLAILDEEGVSPGHYGEMYLSSDSYTIDIHEVE